MTDSHFQAVEATREILDCLGTYIDPDTCLVYKIAAMERLAGGPLAHHGMCAAVALLATALNEVAEVTGKNLEDIISGWRDEVITGLNAAQQGDDLQMRAFEEMLRQSGYPV